MKLSIIVPAYNEAERIGPMLDAYLPYFAARYGDTFEMIVAVNGSRDDPVTLMHPEMERLFPCGEGGGYAGGIISAAMDGQNVARAVALAI